LDDIGAACGVSLFHVAGFERTGIEYPSVYLKILMSMAKRKVFNSVSQVTKPRSRQRCGNWAVELALDITMQQHDVGRASPSVLMDCCSEHRQGLPDGGAVPGRPKNSRVGDVNVRACLSLRIPRIEPDLPSLFPVRLEQLDEAPLRKTPKPAKFRGRLSLIVIALGDYNRNLVLLQFAEHYHGMIG